MSEAPPGGKNKNNNNNKINKARPVKRIMAWTNPASATAHDPEHSRARAERCAQGGWSMTFDRRQQAVQVDSTRLAKAVSF